MNKTVEDPVCGMDVDPKASKDNLHHVVYNGTEYHFCSLFCTAAFVENPEKFIGKDYRKKKDDNDL